MIFESFQAGGEPSCISSGSGYTRVADFVGSHDKKGGVMLKMLGPTDLDYTAMMVTVSYYAYLSLCPFFSVP